MVDDTTSFTESNDSNEQTPMVLHPAYIDFAHCDMQDVLQLQMTNQAHERKQVARSGSRVMFPAKLHGALEACSNSLDLAMAIRWLPHGRAFKIYNKALFVKVVLPQYFPSQKMFASFQRQLNLYGFLKLTGAHADNGAYYHPLLLRGQEPLSHLVMRPDEAESPVRRRFDPRSEPDFYRMLPVYNSEASSKVDSFQTDNATFDSMSNDIEMVGSEYLPFDVTSCQCHDSIDVMVDERSSSSAIRENYDAASVYDEQWLIDQFGPEDSAAAAAAAAVSANDPSDPNMMQLELFTWVSTIETFISDSPCSGCESGIGLGAAQSIYDNTPVRTESLSEVKLSTLGVASCSFHSGPKHVTCWQQSLPIRHELNPRDAVLAAKDTKETINNIGIPMSVEDAVAECDSNVYAALFGSR